MSTEQTVERLNELLDSRDATIEALGHQVSHLESTIRFGVDWMYQARGYLAGDLPVPRLEMAVCENNEYSHGLEVVLVSPNRDGTVTRVPLSYSKRSGAALDVAKLPTEGVVPLELHYCFPNSIFSDLVHYMAKLNLPTFAVLSQSQRYSIEPGVDKPWPVRITAVDLAAAGDAPSSESNQNA